MQAYWQGVTGTLDEPTLLAPVLPHGAHDDSDPLSPPLDASVTLDETQTRRLTEAARRHRITLNTLLQAAWSRVLAQATGHDTVAFGVTTSGRPDSLADACLLYTSRCV